jgi:hypothetical protein
MPECIGAKKTKKRKGADLAPEQFTDVAEKLSGIGLYGAAENFCHLLSRTVDTDEPVI